LIFRARRRRRLNRTPAVGARAGNSSRLVIAVEPTWSASHFHKGAPEWLTFWSIESIGSAKMLPEAVASA
jgi:hypothetical protein